MQAYIHTQKSFELAFLLYKNNVLLKKNAKKNYFLKNLYSSNNIGMLQVNL